MADVSPLKYKKLLDEQVAKGRLIISTYTTLPTTGKYKDMGQTYIVLTEPEAVDLPDSDYFAL